MDSETQILEVIRDVRQSERTLSVKDITSWLVDRHGEDYDRKITTRWVGSVIRRKLHLVTCKSHGNMSSLPRSFRSSTASMPAMGSRLKSRKRRRRRIHSPVGRLGGRWGLCSGRVQVKCLGKSRPEFRC